MAWGWRTDKGHDQFWLPQYAFTPIPGRFYIGQYPSSGDNVAAAATLNAGVERASRADFPVITIDGLALEVTTADATGTYRLGLRRFSPENGGVPGDIIVDAGEIDATSATIQIASITPITLQAGTYFLTCRPTGTTSGGVVRGRIVIDGVMGQSSGGNLNGTGWSQSGGASGPLPTSWTGNTQSGVAHAKVMVRAA